MTIQMLRWAAGTCAIALLLAASLGAREETQDEGVRTMRGGLTQDQALALLDGAPYVPGRVIVKFRPGAGSQARTAALAAVPGAKDDARPRHADFSVIDIPQASDVRAAARTLGSRPDVEYAEPVYVRTLQARPNDPSYGRQWNFQSIGMDTAWDINPGGGSDVTVAVVDSGVAFRSEILTFLRSDGRFLFRVTVPFLAAPDLERPGRFVDPWDFWWSDALPVDMGGHGTHVAGTIAQTTNNRLGLAGVAYNARIMPLKVCATAWDFLFAFARTGIAVLPAGFSECDTAATAEAIRYATDRGARVINLSLGGPNASVAEREAIRYAVSRGVFVAIAAGNDYETGNRTNYPAAFAEDIDGVVAVGAISRNLDRAFYSNTGSYVEIAAPGGNRRRDGDAGGIYQQTLNRGFFDPRVLSPRFDIFLEDSYHGTSMATSHVAGLAALLYSQGITNPAAIEAAIKRFARDLGPAGRDDEYGYGLIDPRATLRGLGVAQ
ncbi:MAG: S8 family serine peptidase [Vicinamibacterales bacterium]